MSIGTSSGEGDEISEDSSSTGGANGSTEFAIWIRTPKISCFTSAPTLAANSFVKQPVGHSWAWRRPWSSAMRRCCRPARMHMHIPAAATGCIACIFHPATFPQLVVIPQCIQCSVLVNLLVLHLWIISWIPGNNFISWGWELHLDSANGNLTAIAPLVCSLQENIECPKNAFFCIALKIEMVSRWSSWCDWIVEISKVKVPTGTAARFLATWAIKLSLCKGNILLAFLNTCLTVRLNAVHLSVRRTGHRVTQKRDKDGTIHSSSL